MKIPSSNLGRIRCVQKLFLTFRTIFVHNMFSPCSAKRRVSDKDLPVKLIVRLRTGGAPKNNQFYVTTIIRVLLLEFYTENEFTNKILPNF